MFIKSLKLANFLSFGPAAPAVPLGNLNVLIGPNGSGKSNFIEALDVLRCAPRDLQAPFRAGGGIEEWIWKGAEEGAAARIEVVINTPCNDALVYALGIGKKNGFFNMTDERIASERDSRVFYQFANGSGILKANGETRHLQETDIDRTQSILSQRRDPDYFPELTSLGDTLPLMRIYRESRESGLQSLRQPQRSDVSPAFLDANLGNLLLVLHSMSGNEQVMRKLIGGLKTLYDGVDGYFVEILPGGAWLRLLLRESGDDIPASRLSDGTLHYLCMLAILCHPNPPPLLCIEEPELGLHPDILPSLAELLLEASERCQIIVTTHSAMLVDSLTEHPEAVFVTEKDENGTRIARLDAADMKPWLEEHRLGELWANGEIGGNRW